ncbi:unnamed protein product [Linum trigynum]|uniref:Uncharacterized protein n=1 Tax=Linum trigynum TaxID=586398 RepID=A0AAV2FI77_9ROSI
MASHNQCRLLIVSILVVLAATMAAADHESSSSTSTVHHHHVDPRCTSPVIHNNNVTETTRKPRQQRDRYISREALRANNVTRCVKADDSHHKKDHVDDHGCSTTSPSDNIKKARKIQHGLGDMKLRYKDLRIKNIPCGWKGNSYYDCRYRKKVNPYTRGRG